MVYNGLKHYSVSDWGIEESDDRGFVSKTSSNEILSSYIRSNLKHINTNETFWEKFKYQLVISNLLEDGMVLSKNDQAINHLGVMDVPFSRPRTLFNDGCIKLLSSNQKYHLTLNGAPLNSILIIIHLIFHLKSQDRDTKAAVQFFRIILVLAVRILRQHSLKVKVLTQKILNNSKLYLILNCKLNRKFILYMIKLKNPNISSNYNDSNDVKILEVISSCLELLIFNLKFSIAKLLPYQNGEMLERYCEINKIKLDFLSDEDVIFPTISEPINERINNVLLKLNKFTQLRKFLISQFLILDSNYKSTFFLNKHQTYFQAKYTKYRFLNTINKLLLLDTIFNESNGQLLNFYSILENYEIMSINENKNLDLIKNNENIFQMIGNTDKVIKNEARSLNLEKLVNKFSNLSTNLKYFQKYNDSTHSHSNVDELNEKIMIFGQFSNDLDQIRELHQLSLADIHKELQVKATGSQTEDVPYNNSEVELKSFRNTTVKKRTSLFANPVNPVYSNSISSNHMDNLLTKKNRRQSPGLSMGLVKVIEENLNKNPAQRYSAHDSYNSSTLDKLQNNSNSSFNRFSTNSATSNISGISDLMNLTEMTSLGEDNAHESMSKGQLRIKLEENLNRMYNKDHIGSKLDIDQLQDIKANPIDKSFLNQLDNTLLSMVDENNPSI